MATIEIPVQPPTDPIGGDVRSNSDTIHALRQGVEVGRRTSIAVIADHTGTDHDVPVALAEAGDGATSVVVSKDLIAEVDRRAAGPRRRSGTVQLGSLDSLIAYVNRFKHREQTVAFAPLDPAGVTVVFDYHPGNDRTAAWREDRATFACPLSRQWKLWLGAAEKPMGQVAFGDFIEANGDDLGPGDPDAGYVDALELLRVARNLTIHERGEFSRKVDVTSGQGTLVVKQEHGESSTKIPKGFRLAIPVFEGSDDTYAVECRIRFAMEGGAPRFAFLLHNRDKVWDHALGELRTRLAAECEIPVFVGNAPQATR